MVEITVGDHVSRPAIGKTRQLAEGGIGITLSTVLTYWLSQGFPEMPEPMVYAHAGLVVFLLSFGLSRARDRGWL